MGMRIPSGPSHTLVLVLDSLVARIDFEGWRKPRLGQVWTQALSSSLTSSQPASATPGLPSAVAQGLRLGPKPAKNVSVASTHFWTDILQLPLEVVSLATDNEIGQALALEAEMESGISPFDCQVAWHRLGGQLDGESFCTTQVSNSLMSELQKTVHSQGSRLCRVSHPIARDLLGGTWAADRLLENLGNWRQMDHSKKLSSGFGEGEPGWIQEFASDWARLIRLPASRAPMLIDLHPDSGAVRVMVESGLIAAATILGASFWHFQTRLHVSQVEQSIQQYEQQLAQYDREVSESEKLESQLVRFRKQSQATQEARRQAEQRSRWAAQVAARENARWSLLLDSMAQCSGECWVQRVDSTDQSTELSGMAPSQSAAHTFAARMAESLHGSGWFVAPAETQPLPSGLFQFRIALVPQDDWDWQHPPASPEVVQHSDVQASGADDFVTAGRESRS